MTWLETIQELDWLESQFKPLLLPKIENQDQVALNKLRARAVEIHYIRIKLVQNGNT